MYSMSHPSWVRGLKLYAKSIMLSLIASHPSWVRGLKYLKHCTCFFVLLSHPSWVRGLKFLFPFFLVQSALVAPFMGAWIEIFLDRHRGDSGTSHPSWVRGLKSNLSVSSLTSILSHPSWVRGLKYLKPV